MTDPQIMGIVDASPESFSGDGGNGMLNDQFVRALGLVEQGAHLIDVGGQAGVTGIPAIDAEEEIRRVVPLVERLAAEDVRVSVARSKPAVGRAALAAGAQMINDASGLREVE